MKTIGQWVLLLVVLVTLTVTLVVFYYSQFKPTVSTQLTPEVSPIPAPPTQIKMGRRQAPAPLTAEIPLIPPAQVRPLIGVNVNELHYEDASFPFVDLFRQSAPFKDNVLEMPAAEQVEYDAQGWPLRLHGAKIATKFIGKMPAGALVEGDYVVLYDGTGILSYGHGVETVSQSPNRDLIRLHQGEDGEINASLVIESMDEADPIKHIRILPPGGICQDNPYQRVFAQTDCASGAAYLPFEQYYPSIRFTPEYLNYLKDFSTIRFMAMSGITRNPESHWSERPNLQEATWGGGYGARGAPLEIQVDLANRMQADAWFNLPHAADDDYIRQFATYVRDHLAPTARIYVEYTNEVWNTSFSHSEYTQKKGIEAGFSINSVEAGYQYYIQRAGEVFAIWEQVFGGRERFTRVLGSWDTRPDISKKFLGDYGGAQIADAMAIAPYFGGNTKGYRESTTVDQIFELTTAKDSFRSLPQVLEHVREQAEIAHHYGLKLIAYEGGQGLVDWVTREPTQHPNPLFFAANRDPRMGELYTQMLTGWKEAGGELFMAFSSPRTCQWFGCWGLKEHIRQPPDSAYKYQAVLSFIEAHRDWLATDTGKQAVPVQQAAARVADLSAEKKPHKPGDPLIVFRPAKDPERYFFLENPRTLDTLIAGQEWAKRDLFGKWEGKWDENYLYLAVRVYDESIKADSDNPEDDDSVEFYIDADNSRQASYDGVNDYRMIFAWGRKQVILDPKSPQTISPDLSYEFKTTADGYVLEAKIPWSMLGVRIGVKSRVGIEVQVNDDDDGGSREQKISWLAREDKAMNDPRLLGVVLISGR
ncbi:sugar-binding protein [Thiothrix eikelboomii]|uniref:sugar-binding protein n=1 Tax=Thiothrix eikelboomii TaxID=92487 RepID=UPI00099BBACB|nr:sugar-binding protein [Thiothrix eikelboomii]